MNEYDAGDADTRSADLVREIEAVLGRRVNELAIQNARLRRRVQLLGAGVIAALLLSVGGAILLYAERSRVADSVHARQFVVRDAAGNVRAVLGPTPEGGSRFSMQDPNGRDRLRLTLLADGSPGLSFADGDGQSRAVLAFLPDGTANLVFADRTGRTRAVFGLMPDESSTLVFADRMGETRVGLGVDPDGSAGLSVFEDDRAPTAQPARDTVPADTSAAGANPDPPAEL
jgi:hypothetical protein